MALRKMQIILLALCLALLTFAVKAPAQTRPRTTTAPAGQQEGAKVLKKDGTEAYLCGAPTKAGGKCKRHVKTKGELCWMHRGK